MPASDQIRARGKIIETVGTDAFRAELANGHRAVVHLPRDAAVSVKIGDEITVEFHPYDLSRGRIIPAV